jgi:hypothetical protein
VHAFAVAFDGKKLRIASPRKRPVRAVARARAKPPAARKKAAAPPKRRAR